MGRDYVGRITVDEFINVWIKAEDILNNKIQQCQKNLRDYNNQRKEAIDKMNDVQWEEVVN